jgi:hypothetical protein
MVEMAMSLCIEKCFPLGAPRGAIVYKGAALNDWD